MDRFSRCFSPSVPLLVLAVLLLAAGPADSQDLYDRTFIPEVGNMSTRFFYQTELYGSRDVAGQNRNFSLTGHHGGVRVPIRQDGDREWSGTALVSVRDISTDAVLPDAGVRFPQSLWNVSLGTQYRQRLDNGWIAGGLLSFGSASDKPFHSYDEMTIQATPFVRIPHNDRNAWLVFANYSNNREFLNHVPIPGFGYWYQPHDKVRMMLGLPFVFFQAGPFDGYSVETSYYPVRNFRVKLSKSLIRDVSLYTSFQWRNESYFRAERSDSDHRLFYYEKRAAAGIEYRFLKECRLDLSAGYAFDRFYFEGDSYSDRDRNRLDIGDSPYLSARLTFDF